MSEKNLYDKIMQLCIEQLTTANTKNGLYKARYLESDPKNEESYKITITEDEARKHINAILLPDMPKEYKTCNDIFRRFLISGQNSGRMFNLISFEKRETQFKNILGVDEQGNADYKQVIEKYVLKQNKELKLEDCTKEIRNQAAEELHSDFFKQIKGDKGQPIVTMGDKSDWRKYARLVIDAALFVGKNSRKDENSRDGDYEVLKNKLDKKLKEEGNYNLQKFIEDNIHGMGKALACDFLKEIGHDMAKPDTHIMAFLERNYSKELNEKEDSLKDYKKNKNIKKREAAAVEVMKDLARDTGHDVYALDKLIWLCCSGNYYKKTAPDNTVFEGVIVEPKSLRDLFLEKMK